MLFRDIECVLVKKHFVGNRGPKELLSPRLESIGLETIDIDSRTRKRQVVEKIAADTVLPTSPCFGLSCEVNHGAWWQAPRSHSFDYFEKTLQTERYAALIGRPSIKSDKEFNRTRLAAIVEKEKTYSGLLETIYSDSAEWEIDQSVGPNAQCESYIKDRTSTLSTTASNASGSPKSDGQKLNIESFWPALRKRGGASDVIGEDRQERGSALPLGLRRVIASMGRHKAEMLSDSLVQELTNHILESQGGKCKTSAGAQLWAASRDRYEAQERVNYPIKLEK
jgi:hypothetical protein